MIHVNNRKYGIELFNNLKNDCKQCFGLCCVALYFSASEGFPHDKVAGTPCANLKEDFSCAIHTCLIEKGLKGCTSYDCFGAGQKVAQVTYNGQNWLKVPGLAQQMFDAFTIMRQLHERLWYLTEALLIETNTNITDNLKQLINETERITYLEANILIDLDLDSHRDKVNALLKKVAKLDGIKFTKRRLDYFGQDLRRANLMGMDLSGALLIAADLRGNNLTGTNLIGADMRDADIRGANLSESLFITQAQVNTAKGDSSTKLPQRLDYPNW